MSVTPQHLFVSRPSVLNLKRPQVYRPRLKLFLVLAMEIRNLCKDFEGFHKIEVQDFQILETPEEFYTSIMRRMQSSHRVFLACLVLGSEGHATRLLDQVCLRVKKGKPTVLFIDKTRTVRNKKLLRYIESKSLSSVVRLVDMSRCRLLPNAINELFRVFHEKAYIFDDEVCISGANLDDPYFINRTDRYFWFKSRALADEVMRCVFLKYKEFLPSDVSYSLISREDSGVGRISGIAKERPETARSDATGDTGSTFMFHFSGSEEFDVIEKVLSRGYNRLVVATSYLNFSSRHNSILAKHSFDLITTSPAANTFNNFSFLGKFITEVYAYSSCITLQKLPGCRLFEYYKPGFSFHSKGVWLFGDDWCVTMIGSTNMNQRSVWMDTERNWLIVSKDEKIIKKLRSEVEGMLVHATEFSWKEASLRKVSFVAKLIFYVMNIFF